MEMLSYVIIDDSKLAHNLLLKLMLIHKNYKCAGQYYDAITAIETLNENKPDFIFLDIEMPNISGFEMIRFIDKSIKIIVMTSHREFAMEGFDHGVIDFLLKPVRHDRLLEALNRVRQYIQLEKKPLEKKTIQKNSNISYICATRLREKNPIQIEKKDIYYIKKQGNHIEIFTDNDGPFYKIESIKEMMSLLPDTDFLLVNQSYIFNKEKAVCEDGEHIILDGEFIRISNANRRNWEYKKNK